jgi:hypothetical protein
MNALASPNAIESAVAVEPAVESEQEQEYPGRSLNIPFDGERIKSSVALFSKGIGRTDF